jgi:hypothetical protein
MHLAPRTGARIVEALKTGHLYDREESRDNEAAHVLYLGFVRDCSSFLVSLAIYSLIEPARAHAQTGCAEPKLDERKIDGTTISKTERIYSNSSSHNPTSIKFYRTPMTAIEMSLTYYGPSASGHKGT